MPKTFASINNAPPLGVWTFFVKTSTHVSVGALICFHGISNLLEEVSAHIGSTISADAHVKATNINAELYLKNNLNGIALLNDNGCVIF